MRKLYTPKGVTTSISADIKMTIMIRNNYYSVAGHEERTIPQDPDVDIEKEWEFLYEELQDSVAQELQQIKDSLKIKNKNFTNS